MSTTVLLIESDAESRTVCVESLRAAGLNVIALPNARTTLEALKTILPKVIIARLDPAVREDHVDLCRRIKIDPVTKHIALVLVGETAADDALATELGALVLGAAPADTSKLVAAIHGLTLRRAEPLRASLPGPGDAKQSA
jgi:DNA-binding response OmpR family regulator